MSETLITRRAFGLGALGAGALFAGAGPALAAKPYPERNFKVIIPTGQGGGAERLARPFDDAWSKHLKKQFEYTFHPGAAGQVGYELFVKRNPRDGHHLLFGNMGPEMIMYAVQKPDFKFPQDITYFCRMDIDDSCIFVKRDSPLKDLQSIVDAAKKRPLNVAVSRIPHPASIGILALGDAVGAKFNLIPYGGGNPTYIAVLNGEADIGALPIAGTLSMTDRLKVLGVFSGENIFAKLTENAPTVNQVFGTKIPDLYSSRAWAVHTEWADANPAEFDFLQKTAEMAHADPTFRDAYVKAGSPAESLKYGDRKVCMDYALGMLELAQRYEKVLSAAK
ncbi:tripartite tricarboxylate transporter substrate-binding protein [Prosthecomicrobium sp. N25]|uniref:tripartite tricarboxylate transporter substrate-binding protein n=1 Tax=Prosthecomicrobium sp. N25 TaxID=3129254 RepID=UPI00307835FE